MRKRQYNMSDMIISFLAERPENELLSPECVVFDKGILVDCVWHGDLKVLHKIVRWHKSLIPEACATLEEAHCPPITEEELGHLFACGHLNLLRRMLRDGILYANTMGAYLARLDVAISRDRYNVAQLLLTEGANINAQAQNGHLLL